MLTHMLTHNVHMCSYTPTHAHTCAHTHAYKHMLTHTHALAHMHTRMFPHPCSHTDSHSHMHDLIHMHDLTCIHTLSHAHTHACSHTVRTHDLLHKHTYTCTVSQHTHACTCMLTCACAHTYTLLTGRVPPGMGERNLVKAKHLKYIRGQRHPNTNIISGKFPEDTPGRTEHTCAEPLAQPIPILEGMGCGCVYPPAVAGCWVESRHNGKYIC